MIEALMVWILSRRPEFACLPVHPGLPENGPVTLGIDDYSCNRVIGQVIYAINLGYSPWKVVACQDGVLLLTNQKGEYGWTPDRRVKKPVASSFVSAPHS